MGLTDKTPSVRRPAPAKLREPYIPEASVEPIPNPRASRHSSAGYYMPSCTDTLPQPPSLRPMATWPAPQLRPPPPAHIRPLRSTPAPILNPTTNRPYSQKAAVPRPSSVEYRYRPMKEYESPIQSTSRSSTSNLLRVSGSDVEKSPMHVRESSLREAKGLASAKTF